MLITGIHLGSVGLIQTEVLGDKTKDTRRERFGYNCTKVHTLVLLLLGGELLTERCHTNDVMPSIHVLCLPPSRVDPQVLGLDVLIYHSQPGGSWTTRRSPPIRWWSQRGGDDMVVVLLVLRTRNGRIRNGLSLANKKNKKSAS